MNIKTPMNKSISISLAYAATLVFSMQAHALIVNSPGIYSLPGTTVAVEPQLAGVVLEDILNTVTYTNENDDLNFVVQSRVIRSTDGTIDFAWRVRDVKGTGDITSLRIGDFGGFYNSNINYRTDGLGNIAPSDIKVFDNDHINFLFDGGIAAGESSYFLFIDTDATAYAETASFDLTFTNNNGTSTSYSTFAPSEVPLPATAWLFGSALIGLLFKRNK